MSPRKVIDRRDFLKVTGGTAAAFALGGRSVASARQDDAAATEAANATATAEAQGVTVTTPVAGKTNVTWWTHNNPAFVEANKGVIDRFEQANPDVHIVYQYFPYDVFIRKLQTGYRSGTVADVQQMFGTWVTEYARNGLLDPVPDDFAGGMERFFPAARGAYEFDGRFYGMPNEFNIEAGGMLINPQKFAEAGIAEPPATWQQLIDYGVRLTKLEDGGKRASQVGFAFTGTDPITFLTMAMTLQQGATYWADDGVHVNFSTDAAKQAWRDLTGLVTQHKVDNEQWYDGDPFEAFFRGQAAMAYHGPWVIAVGKEQFPDAPFQYVAVPPYAGDRFLFAAESGWGEVVNAQADDEVKAAAWRFIDFFHQDDQLREWSIGTFTIPSLTALQNDPRILEVAPELKVSFDLLPLGQWVGPVQDRDRFWTYVHDAFTNVGLGRKQPDEALAEAEQQINAMIDEKLGP